MSVDELRDDLIVTQKKGLPFIAASVVIWLLIAIVASLGLDIAVQNILVLCCAAPLLPLAWLIGKRIGVEIFAQDNTLSKVGFVFTMNQALYLLIVIWAFNAAPHQMIMVYAMVFGAHLLPFSWLYKSVTYRVFAIVIPIVSLVLGSVFNGLAVAAAATVMELVFVVLLVREVRQATKS